MDSEVRKTVNNNTPLLIYDGDCSFCVYWASYWQKLTANSVNYKSYQEVAPQFPTIPIAAFKRAVQYVAPDGAVSSAAKASFLTLSHAPGKAFWLSLYRKLPGFALLSETVYAFIAAHRNFFYRLTLFFYGRHYEPPRYNWLCWLFLRGLGLIYLFAFISFGVQALGIIGSRGLVPVQELTAALNSQVGPARYWYLPMIFWLNSSDLLIQASCWLGAALSLLLVFNRRPRCCLFFLYLLYLSLTSAGQFFMSFQWDMFLLETGVLAFFVLRPSTLGIWLLRWLLFRFMFMGGLVKLLSGDSAWWPDLTALSYYFFTEPLPTPLAWYAHNFPQTLLTFGTALTLFIEIFLPFLIFCPRKLRFLAGFAFLFLQTLILLSGNYNFFNLQTMLLCLVLFDDAALRAVIPRRLSSFLPHSVPVFKTRKMITVAKTSFVVLTVSLSLLQFYSRFVGPIARPLAVLHDIFIPLRITNTYGPFAVMTKERMEIIFEGSNDGVEWREYQFKYKPGDVKRRPPWNIPHQPRLDWQLWFAALSSPEQNQWVLRLMQRILENSAPVLALLATNPFPDKAPIYLRAQFYDYRFTDWDSWQKTGAWWERRYVQEYFPALHLQAVV